MSIIYPYKKAAHSVKAMHRLCVANTSLVVIYDILSYVGGVNLNILLFTINYLHFYGAKVHKKNDIRKCYVIFFRNICNIRLIRIVHTSVCGLGKHTCRGVKANDAPWG